MCAYIDICHITKRFFGVTALDDVSFGIERGTVHAIIGENGAGKSTLMKILGGVYRPDGGAVQIDGRHVDIRRVDDARNNGISVIYQEFNLVPELTVAENMFLSDTPVHRFPGLVDRRRRSREAAKFLAALDVNVDPDEFVKNLSVSQKQMVEIARALSQNADILIMDEPTAALNDDEVKKLEEIIRMLKEQGKTILYISHRLREIFEVSDSITVLRNGKYVDTRPAAELTERDLIRMMIGHEIDLTHRSTTFAEEKTVLEVRGFSLEGIFSDVSFSLRRGEILGVAGLMGCGREEMLAALYGLYQRDKGEVFMEGHPVNINSPVDAISHGICFLTDDRKDEGLLPLMSVQDNLTVMSIKELKKRLGLFLRPKDEREQLDSMGAWLKLKYAWPGQRISYLSGGNQQKVILGRNLLLENKVFIMLEPTRGIDVGAKEEIYQLLFKLAGRGMGIIAVFSDLTELIRVCDRAIVFFNGRISGELTREELDRERLLSLATGNVTGDGETR